MQQAAQEERQFIVKTFSDYSAVYLGVTHQVLGNLGVRLSIKIPSDKFA